MTAPERVTFETQDGVRIVGLVWPATLATLTLDAGPWALLLHMMPATKESWEPLARALAALGVNVLAIDERGHGESIHAMYGTIDYRTFTPEEQQTKLLDIDASVAWLVGTRGAVRSSIALCGASIGANLAIAYAAGDPRISAIAAVSPGLDYRGVTTEDKISAMPAATRIFLAASDDDDESFSCVRQLAAMRRFVTLRELHGAGHGTPMFDAEPKLLREVAEWIAKVLR